MVIVIMTDGHDRTAAALSAELGWPVVEALTQPLDRIRQRIEAALDRRAPLILTTRALSRPERLLVARHLAPVRFVSLGPLGDQPGPAQRDADEPLTIAPDRDPHADVRTLRHAFGL